MAAKWGVLLRLLFSTFFTLWIVLNNCFYFRLPSLPEAHHGEISVQLSWILRTAAHKCCPNPASGPDSFYRHGWSTVGHMQSHAICSKNVKVYCGSNRKKWGSIRRPYSRRSAKGMGNQISLTFVHARLHLSLGKVFYA